MGSKLISRIWRRSYCNDTTTVMKSNLLTEKTPKSKNTLFSRVIELGDPDTSLIPVLNNWIQEGRKIRPFELPRIVRDLRSRQRYSQALEISEWMISKENGESSVSGRAVLLDLIGRVRGIESAEAYFDNLDDKAKIDKVYGALLNCYVREGLVEKSLMQMQKMMELGFATSPLNYNDLMCLYTHTGQFEKVPGVFSEMKENGITPDIYSYRICMNSYGKRSDLENVEKILEEMENRPHISMDWLTYAAVARIYIREGLKEKALVYLKKCEEKLNKDAVGYNHLISLYAQLGNKDQVMKFWRLAKANCKKLINRDYITILGCLVKIGELDEAEKLLEDWESSCHFFDLRVPNTLLIGFCQRGMVERAESMLRNIIEKHKTVIPNSWAIIAEGYAANQNMEKAFECMSEALAVKGENKRWRPKPELITGLLKWLGENGNVEQVETFVCSLEDKILESRDAYNALVKANIRGGRHTNGLLEKAKVIKDGEKEQISEENS